MKLVKVKKPLIKLQKPTYSVVATNKGWACNQCKEVLSRVSKNYSYEHCMFCGAPLDWSFTPFKE